MESHYKSALDKIKLSEFQKDRAKHLFYEVDEERRNHMRARSLLKPVAAVAAGLAIVVAANIAIPMLQSQSNPLDVSSHTAISSNSNKTNILTAMAENYFTVTAYAKELTETGKVYQDNYLSQGYMMCGDSEDKGKITAAFHFPIECKGENIDTITYAVKEGAFQITNPKGQSIVLDGEKLKKELNVPGTSPGGVEDSELETIQYKSFTVNYEKQNDELTCIDIVNTSDIWSSKKRNAYKKIGYDVSENTSLKKEKKVGNFLTRDLGMTCTVTYKDGSTETKEILITNDITRISETFDKNVAKEEDREVVVRYFSIQ